MTPSPLPHRATPEQWASLEEAWQAYKAGSWDTPHCATPEQWADVQERADGCQGGPACLLEVALQGIVLRARVEALEAAMAAQGRRQQDEDADRVGEPAAPVGSLVAGVRKAIVVHGDGETYTDEARAAIYEVANWLEQFEFVGAVYALRKEVKRG